MKNNSHIETKEKRLARLISNPPLEAIETLLNSIANYFNNEIKITPISYQSSLLIIGIHAVALTISEALFNKNGKDGYKEFLTRFLDGNNEDTKFSIIATDLHDWRNILAHQWIGTLGHTIQYDYDMDAGWMKDEDILKINPKIYCDLYLKAFSSGGKIWKYETMLTLQQLEEAKIRIINKYQRK